MTPNLLRQLQAVDWDFPEIDAEATSAIHWYPGTFPPQLPGTLIEALTTKGSVVFDPYGGTGTTVVAALRAARKSWYIDQCPIGYLTAYVTSGLILAKSVDSTMYIPTMAAIERILGGNLFQSDLFSSIDEKSIDNTLDHLMRPKPQDVLSSICSKFPSKWSLLSPWYEPNTLQEIKKLLSKVLNSDLSSFGKLFGLLMISATLRNASSQNRSWGHIADNVLPDEFTQKEVTESCKRWLSRVNGTLGRSRVMPIESKNRRVVQFWASCHDWRSEAAPELKQRTNNQPERDEGEPAFTNQRKIVKACDCVLHGDVKAVTDALVSTIWALKSKGVLDKQSITNLINSGTLLGDANIGNIQPASYDLCVGNTVWCRGKRSDLKPNDVVSIPPYSYIIVQAHEKALLPKFIIAHYDLKVSLFAQGIILSNGPQVDPGYDGVLLCMLFNGSDIEVGLKCGDHFATIEFLVTNRITEGYRDHHQHQNTLGDFIDTHAHVSPGGTILQQFEAIKSSWDNFKTAFFLPTIGIVLATIIALVLLGIWGYETADKSSKATEQAQKATDKLSGMVDENSNLLTQVTTALQSMHDFQSRLTNKDVPLIMTNIQTQSPTSHILTGPTSK